MLEYAEKYNWWTPDKKNISLDAKIAYILEYGTLLELKNMIQTVGKIPVEKVWKEKFQKAGKRKALITSLFKVLV